MSILLVINPRPSWECSEASPTIGESGHEHPSDHRLDIKSSQRLHRNPHLTSSGVPLFGLTYNGPLNPQWGARIHPPEVGPPAPAPVPCAFQTASWWFRFLLTSVFPSPAAVALLPVIVIVLSRTSNRQ